METEVFGRGLGSEVNQRQDKRNFVSCLEFSMNPLAFLLFTLACRDA